jgi:hypothetical protein
MGLSNTPSILGDSVSLGIWILSSDEELRYFGKQLIRRKMDRENSILFFIFINLFEQTMPNLQFHPLLSSRVNVSHAQKVHPLSKILFLAA